MNKLYLLILLTMGLLAESYTMKTQTVKRFTDTNEEYGKSCESYSYIPALERLSLISHTEFLLGDLLTDTLAIPAVDENRLQEYNKSICSKIQYNISKYEYTENLEYLSNDIVSIDIFQYKYGAGAAHGNGHNSHYLYERDYGMALQWENLFIKDDAFDRYIIKRVIKEIAEKEFIEYFKASEQILNYAHTGYFGLNKEGLIIQYGKYEIASGSAGLPSLIIPKDVLKKYMRPGMYKKCFTEGKPQILEARNDH